MCRALERGLTLSDFKDLTVGMIIGYVTTYNELNSEKEEETKEATQDDFDKF